MAAARQRSVRLRNKSSKANKLNDGSSSHDNVHASERHSLSHGDDDHAFEPQSPSDEDDDHGDKMTAYKYVPLKRVRRITKSRSGKFVKKAQSQHGSKDRSARSGSAGPMPIDNDTYRLIDPGWLSLKKRDFEAREFCHPHEVTDPTVGAAATAQNEWRTWLGDMYNDVAPYMPLLRDARSTSPLNEFRQAHTANTPETARGTVSIAKNNPSHLESTRVNSQGAADGVILALYTQPRHDDNSVTHEKLYDHCFPRPVEVLQTSGEDEMCSLHALELSFKFQFPHLPPVTFEQLLAKLHELHANEEFKDQLSEIATAIPGESTNRFLTGDVAALVLQQYSKDTFNLNISMAVRRDDGWVYFYDDGSGTAEPCWVYNANCVHFSGMRLALDTAAPTTIPKTPQTKSVTRVQDEELPAAQSNLGRIFQDPPTHSGHDNNLQLKYMFQFPQGARSYPVPRRNGSSVLDAVCMSIQHQMSDVGVTIEDLQRKISGTRDSESQITYSLAAQALADVAWDRKQIINLLVLQQDGRLLYKTSKYQDDADREGKDLVIWYNGRKGRAALYEGMGALDQQPNKTVVLPNAPWTELPQAEQANAIITDIDGVADLYDDEEVEIGNDVGNNVMPCSDPMLPPATPSKRQASPTEPVEVVPKTPRRATSVTSSALAIRSKTLKTPKLHDEDTPNSPRYAQFPLARVTRGSRVFGARASRERLHTRKSREQVNVPLPRAESQLPRPQSPSDFQYPEELFEKFRKELEKMVATECVYLDQFSVRSIGEAFTAITIRDAARYYAWRALLREQIADKKDMQKASQKERNE